MNCKEKLLEVRDLHKVYTKEGVPTKALNGITFNVLNGEYLGIMGASGSGKTTLLNCIATVIKPTAGQILLSGANISSFDGGKLAEYRGNISCIVCGIAVSVLCVLILTKVQKNTENSK